MTPEIVTAHFRRNMNTNEIAKLLRIPEWEVEKLLNRSSDKPVKYSAFGFNLHNRVGK